MSLRDRLGLGLLHRLDPETAHRAALAALRLGVAPLPQVPDLPRLRTALAGMALANPLGLAAGFDKDATVPAPLSRAGFGFVELGGVTPRAQPGNPRPRLFRLPADRAVINRFGLNNDGAHAVAARLARHRRTVPLGLNLGANKDSADRAADYAEVLRICGPHIDFATVNVSSPNTERLRELQGAQALTALLAGVTQVRGALARRIPVFVKIAPDLSDAEIADIAGVALSSGIDGIIATNTTIAREGLTDPHSGETGGLSGRPLFRRSTQVLARLARETGGRIPLIGVGGIEDAETAYAKIRAGATALQLYSALVYEGLPLIPRILTGLDALLERDGFATIAQATGTAIEDWT